MVGYVGLFAYLYVGSLESLCIVYEIIYLGEILHLHFAYDTQLICRSDS